LTCAKLMEVGLLSGNQILQVASLLGMSEKDFDQKQIAIE